MRKQFMHVYHNTDIANAVKIERGASTIAFIFANTKDGHICKYYSILQEYAWFARSTFHADL